MSLSFENPVFYDPKNTVEECKEKDFTYSAPLYVSAEFTNNETGEIKGQTVFMGDFPLMTDKGTFIINGTERVVVSQLVRSPGVYFERTADKTSDKDIFTAKVIPSRGAWLEFEIDKRDMVGVRLDRKRKQNVTVLLKALQAVADEETGEEYDYEAVMADLRQYESIAADRGEGPHPGPRRRAARHLPQAAPGRAADARGRADAAGELLLQPQALRPGQGRPLQDQQEARQHRGVRPADADDRRHRRGDPLHRRAARRQDRASTVAAGAGDGIEVRADDIDHFGNRRMRTVGELIQNQLRTGLARMERVVRERMTTQDVEAITPQSLINIRPVVAALKEFFGTSQLSQFMDQTNPIAGPDAQAPALRARPRWSLP